MQGFVVAVAVQRGNAMIMLTGYTRAASVQARKACRAADEGGAKEQGDMT